MAFENIYENTSVPASQFPHVKHQVDMLIAALRKERGDKKVLIKLIYDFRRTINESWKYRMGDGWSVF